MGDDERTALDRDELQLDELEPDELGGDAACWLGSVCAGCGAMIEGPPGTACWRCGGTRREGD